MTEKEEYINSPLENEIKLSIIKPMLSIRKKIPPNKKDAFKNQHPPKKTIFCAKTPSPEYLCKAPLDKTFI